jgi:hypothetical protein
MVNRCFQQGEAFMSRWIRIGCHRRGHVDLDKRLLPKFSNNSRGDT